MAFALHGAPCGDDAGSMVVDDREDNHEQPTPH